MLRLLAFLLSFVFGAPAVFAQLPIGFGVKGGVALTDAFNTSSTSESIASGTTLVQTSSVSLSSYSDAKDYLIGPFVELRLPFGLGAEVDALYRPLSFATSNTSTSGTFYTSERFSSWEFPVLGKYRFKSHIVRPYVDAGPSFRSVSGSAGPYFSNHGFAAGAGVDFKLLLLHISPEIRYTRWASGSPSVATAVYPATDPKLNQVELLVGISF